MFCEGRQANARHRVLRIFRWHVPDGLGLKGGRKQQETRAGQHTEKSQLVLQIHRVGPIAAAR